MEKYAHLQEIKENSSSTIYKGINIQDKKEYKLKIINLSNLSEEKREQTLNYIHFLSDIKCEYIISYKEVFYIDDNKQNLVIVNEIPDKGNLLKKINDYKNRNKYFKESEIREIFIQIVKGLKYLHKRNIIHCNLTSSNILLYKNGRAKIGNLKMSIKSIIGKEFNYISSPWSPSYQYESPEKQKRQQIDIKTDIWSLGCILYEMTTLNLPFKDRNVYDITENIMIYRVQNLPVYFSNNLFNIISLLIRTIPDKRLSCEEILKHNFIKNTNNINIFKIDNKVNHFIQEEELKFNEMKYLEMSISKINGNYHCKKYRKQNCGIFNRNNNHFRKQLSQQNFLTIPKYPHNLRYKNQYYSNQTSESNSPNVTRSNYYRTKYKDNKNPYYRDSYSDKKNKEKEESPLSRVGSSIITNNLFNSKGIEKYKNKINQNRKFYENNQNIYYEKYSSIHEENET